MSPYFKNLSRSSWFEISFSKLPTNNVRVAFGWCSSSSASGGRNSLSSTSVKQNKIAINVNTIYVSLQGLYLHYHTFESSQDTLML